MIPIAKPIIGEEEKRALLEVLDSGVLANGDWVREFEEEFSQKIGVNYGIATSSGTTALHGALLAAGIGKGDVVVTSPFTFIATSNAVLFCGGEPIFADIQEDTFNLDPDKLYQVLKENPGVKALILVHLYGLPAPMDEIMELVSQFGLLLIEDSAQAHGATYKGKPVGSFGHLSVFSFYPTKNMTTSEGGMILTSDERLMERARSLINHGERERYYHQELGYNYRMTNMAAALGKVQLKRLAQFNLKRQENARYLTKALRLLPGIITPSIPEGSQHVFHQYTIRVKEREELISLLKEREIGYGIYYPLPVNHQPFYERFYEHGLTPVSDRLSKEVLSLPVHPSLTLDDLDAIIEAVSIYAKKRKGIF